MQLTRYSQMSYKSLLQMYAEPSIANFAQLSYPLLMLGSSTFFGQYVGMLHDIIEIGTDVKQIATKGCSHKEVLQIGVNVLSLTAQATGLAHLRVALLAITTFSHLYQARENFKNTNYIEAATSILCASIHLHKNREFLADYANQWNVKEVEPELRSEGIERRLAVDVGSGGTKVIIADVDTKNNRIVQIVHKTSIPVAYQKDLENSKDGCFSKQIQQQGLETFEQINALARQHSVDRMHAVATAAFRTSENGQEFAQTVQERTGIHLQIIPQREEGVLAYESVKGAADLPSENYVCWDIGTGSFQITSPSDQKEYDVYMTETGSVPFKNHVISHAKGQDPTRIETPNPLTPDATKKADSYARAIGRAALKPIKIRVKENVGRVVGIGRLFQNSLLPLAAGDEIKRKDLRKFIRNAQGKSDEDLNNPFASVDVPNAILALGVMKALHIKSIQVKEATSTEGILLHKEYWEMGSA